MIIVDSTPKMVLPVEIVPQIVVRVEDKQNNRLHFSYLQLDKNIVNPLMEMP